MLSEAKNPSPARGATGPGYGFFASLSMTWVMVVMKFHDDMGDGGYKISL